MKRITREKKGKKEKERTKLHKVKQDENNQSAAKGLFFVIESESFEPFQSFFFFIHIFDEGFPDGVKAFQLIIS